MHSIGISLMYSGDFAAAAAAMDQWNQFYPGSHWSYVKHALTLALAGRCEEAAIPAKTAERLSQGNGSPLYEAWLAFGYQVCGRDDLYSVSKSRLDSFQDTDPDNIDVGLIFYRVLEEDVDGAIEKIQQSIDAKSSFTPFVQLFLLDHMPWPRADDLAADPRLRKLVRELDFPLSEWSVH